MDEKSFTIPFAHVQLRGSKGNLLKNRWAFVPARYLVEFDVESMREAAMQEVADRYGIDSPAYLRMLKNMGVSHEA